MAHHFFQAAQPNSAVYAAQCLSDEKFNIQMTVGEFAFIAAASTPYFYVLVF
jgi:hypothetical protein